MQERLTELQELCAQVTDIERETESYEKKIRSLRQPLPGLFKRIIELKWGVTGGSIVQDRRGNKFKVLHFRNYDTSHKPESWNKPWIIGNPQKKDGTFGTAERNLFDYWTPVKDEQAESKA